MGRVRLGGGEYRPDCVPAVLGMERRGIQGRRIEGV